MESEADREGLAKPLALWDHERPGDVLRPERILAVVSQWDTMSQMVRGSELQYKCQLFPILSTENAEIMENFP